MASRPHAENRDSLLSTIAEHNVVVVDQMRGDVRYRIPVLASGSDAEVQAARARLRPQQNAPPIGSMSILRICPAEKVPPRRNPLPLRKHVGRESQRGRLASGMPEDDPLGCGWIVFIVPSPASCERPSDVSARAPLAPSSICTFQERFAAPGRIVSSQTAATKQFAARDFADPPPDQAHGDGAGRRRPLPATSFPSTLYCAPAFKSARPRSATNRRTRRPVCVHGRPPYPGLSRCRSTSTQTAKKAGYHDHLRN